MDNNFIRKVKEEYPNTFGMRQALDKDNYLAVGSFLYEDHEFDRFDMSLEELLVALNEDRIHDIKEAVEKAIRLKALFSEWKKQVKTL